VQIYLRGGLTERKALKPQVCARQPLYTLTPSLVFLRQPWRPGLQPLHAQQRDLFGD
jgi:hypothetical protein